MKYNLLAKLIRNQNKQWSKHFKTRTKLHRQMQMFKAIKIETQTMRITLQIEQESHKHLDQHRKTMKFIIKHSLRAISARSSFTMKCLTRITCSAMNLRRCSLKKSTREEKACRERRREVQLLRRNQHSIHNLPRKTKKGKTKLLKIELSWTKSVKKKSNKT